MEQTAKTPSITKHLTLPSNLSKVLVVVILAALSAGVLTGYMASTGKSGAKNVATLGQTPKTASQDNQTFRDFAEGIIKSKPTSDPNQYSEGTHLLEREGSVPVALTSSVVDLSQYEGKKVKVYGETQKALKEGWLMDVGRVEETK